MDGYYYNATISVLHDFRSEFMYRFKVEKIKAALKKVKVDFNSGIIPIIDASHSRQYFLTWGAKSLKVTEIVLFRKDKPGISYYTIQLFNLNGVAEDSTIKKFPSDFSKEELYKQVIKETII